MKLKQDCFLSATIRTFQFRCHLFPTFYARSVISCFLLFVGALVGADGADIKIIEINADDTMRYDVTAFEVNAGQNVRIVFKNVGKLPKVAMGHNLIVLKEGIEMAEFAQVAMTAKESEFIPELKRGEIIAHTKLLGPGEIDTIEFIAPAKLGNYTYFCSFPGHWVLMKGVMTVK
ncbi:MAG: Azurin-2 [Candidatus Moanabacter tarae]|uniref:Azurin-2 n=1 Tax=Candidatus Moanibacter tarae TaxID=2200854 RepID=A0A2Z4ACN0_9BACT|nr:MAG: Azurin-2 [Candidatus Moanabacter tarae]